MEIRDEQNRPLAERITLIWPAAQATIDVDDDCLTIKRDGQPDLLLMLYTEYCDEEHWDWADKRRSTLGEALTAILKGE